MLMFNTSRLSSLLLAVVFYLSINLSHVADSVRFNKRFPSFQSFIQRFSKHYDSQTEYLKRQAIYFSSIEFIKRSNCDSCGVNFYADWTQSQIQGLRTVRESPLKQQIGATPNFQTVFTERRLTETMPQTFDWRNQSKVTPVKYEGYCGASWAFSTAAFFEQVSIMAGIANETLDLAEAYLIACNPENQGCKAGEIESSIDKVIDNRGLPLEKQYPYNPDLSTASAICFESNLFTVPNISRISYYKIHDPETIKRIIFKKPVIAAVCGLDLSFYMPPSNSTPGRTLKCKPQNRIIDHSVLLVGYTETEWIVKNHWGTGWGVDGYGYISRNPSEDCCIGEQIHSSGAITPTCSVQYCQTCVETDTCYKCETGRWVKHNTTTGVQTCEPCTELNCAECYNYKGTCKWCADGFGLDSTINSTSSGKCITGSITNCNLISGTNCLQCIPGFRVNSARTSCSPYCTVSSCMKCITGGCTECKAGFGLVSQVIGGKTTPFCTLNPCSVGNCTYCNSTGQCISCLGGFILQAGGSCVTNCTTISNCVNCTAGSNSCLECVEPRSWNSSKRSCDIFALTSNCRVHRTSCTSCRVGYRLSSGQCIQICGSTLCSACLKRDTFICTTCLNGYHLTNTTINGTTYSGVCIPNPCNITNCSLCGVNGVNCVACLTKYLIFNATSNQCQNLCKMSNCRDCLTTGATAGQCDFCNTGYCVDYFSKQCVLCNITNCLQSYEYKEVQYCWQCMDDYYSDREQLNCYIYCTDEYCQDCKIESLFACTKCFDGYFMQLIDGALICSLMVSTVKGCDLVSFNQTYCFECAQLYAKNNGTGLCQLHTSSCPSYCEYCSTNQSLYFECKCVSGVFQWYTEVCLTSPFNDTDCYIVELYGSGYYCMKCLNGKIVNFNENGCDPACIVDNCSLCDAGYNKYCQICNEGFFITTNQKCQQCPFNNCKTCQNTFKCLECMIGYELAPNQRECLPIPCQKGFISTGYECVCPTGTFQTPLKCERCTEPNCKSCSATKCFECDASFYLSTDFKCKKCLPNCQLCDSGNSCNLCVDGYLYDTNTSQCIRPSAQGGAFLINGYVVISCPVNCLECDNLAKCTKCSPGFSVVAGFCVNCQGLCKTCQSTNTTACTSCEAGFFLNHTSCIRCSDNKCEKCTISTTFCQKCRESFYLENSTCKTCAGQNCVQCNGQGKCTQCSAGFGLTANSTCRQCAINCISCNGDALTECLAVCNSSQYQSDDTCQNCPSKCLTCLSADICSSCVSGYLLRNGSCKPACGVGCFVCDDNNNDVCLQCFAGYMLSEVGLCNPDITCNSNQTCFFCPANWTVVNTNCEICATEGNCVQCALGNTQQCIVCKDGFFLNDTLCTACEPNCLTCSSLERCQLCKDGFLIPRPEVYGNCTACDHTCKTCANLPSECSSCREGYEMSLTKKCLRLERIQGEVELDITTAGFPAVSEEVRDSLLEMAGTDFENGSKYYGIVELREGSVILSFRLAIPEGEDADETYQIFAGQLSNVTEIAGVLLIAVKKLELYKPPKNDSPDNPVPEPEVLVMPTEGSSNNNLAIILGVVIPSVIIILAVIAFAFRRKLFKSSNPGIENMAEDFGKQNSSDFVIPMRGKLPPLISVSNTSFTPLKDEKMDMTGQNRTYFNSTGFPQEQSYSKLDGLYDESRNEFDQTLNNIVAELNEGRANGLNLIAEDDHLNEFNEDLSEIKGSQREMIENQAILERLNGEMGDIEFEADTLRKMNEVPEQSLQGKAQTKLGDKGHLQIIEFEQEVQPEDTQSL